MATVKTKFRASSSSTKEGTLFYQVIHKRVPRQIHTGYKLYPQEWDAENKEIVFPPGIGDNRRNYLVSLKDALRKDIKRLKSIIRVSNVRTELIRQRMWWKVTFHRPIPTVLYPLPTRLSGS